MQNFLIKTLIICGILLSYPGMSFCQTTLFGFVKTSEGRPLPLASIAIFKDSTLVISALSNENGLFHLAALFQTGERYRLQCSHAGYQKFERTFQFPDTAFLDSIVLLQLSTSLADVQIRARTPLVTRQADRYIVTIENSFLANARSALEVLQNSPGLWVDSKGSIRLKGTQPVLVMINDVVQQMSGDELADYLRTLRSEDISRIEVIPNPPSEFEASGSGGIINIVLKKNRRRGWNGSSTIQYRIQRRSYFGGGTTINYGTKKFSLSGTYSILKEKRTIRERADIVNQSSFYHNTTDRREEIMRNQYRVTAAYDITSRQLVSLQSSLNTTHNPIEFFASESLDTNSTYGKRLSTSSKDRSFTFLSNTINYQISLDTAGASLKIIADHTRNRKDELNFFNLAFADASLNDYSRNSAPALTNIYSVQADYVKPYRKILITRTGIKWASIKRANRLATESFRNNAWMKDPVLSNNFRYNENSVMMYASAEGSSKKTSFKAGVRAEQTLADGADDSLRFQVSRSYFGLYPSVFIMHNFNPKKGAALSFSYGRRLARPSLSDLNPARLFYSNYTAMRGNPNLRPQFTHNFSLSYSPVRNYTADIYFTRTTNYIALSALNQNNVIEYLSENVGNTNETGISITTSTVILPGWTMNNNASAFYSSYYYNKRLYRQTSCYFKSINAFSFKNGFEADAIANFRSPYVYSNLYTYGNISIDAGITKKLMHGKGRARLAVTDVFNSVREKEVTDEYGNYIFFYRKRPTRSVSFSFTYNFSQGRDPNLRKVEQGGVDEKGRIGN